MSYQQQYDRSNQRPALERIEIAMLVKAGAVAGSIGPAPTEQEARDALLAYDVIRNGAALAPRMLRLLVAMNASTDPAGVTDNQLQTAVDGAWSAMAGVVADTRPVTIGG